MAKKKQDSGVKREASSEKKKLVKELAAQMDKSRTIMITSSLNIPSSLFQKIRKSLRDKAEVKIVKKNLGIRAINQSNKEGLHNLSQYVKEGSAFIFSESDPYELAVIFAENKQRAKAKAGQISPDDLAVEKGLTDLLPGPAISELGAVGLKVGVEGGKIAIKEHKVIAKKGAVISKGVADVLQKLGIMPFTIGIEPIVAYDSINKKVYTSIIVDKEGFLNKLKSAFSIANAFAVNTGYVCRETVVAVMQRAEREALALQKLIKPAEMPAQ